MKKYCTEKKTKHTPSCYTIFTNYLFDPTKSKPDCYKGGDCMERFCIDLRKHATRIINYQKKEIILLTDEENKSCKKQKVCYICKKELSTDKNDKNVFKLNHCHYTGKFRRAAHSICNLRYKTPKEIPVVFHNCSTCDYHYIINKLAKQCDGQLECVGENTEKYIIFSVSIKKKLNNNKTINERTLSMKEGRLEGFTNFSKKIS